MADGNPSAIFMFLSLFHSLPVDKSINIVEKKSYKADHDSITSKHECQWNA